MGNKRIDYLDTCKGILIILVVIGHAIEIVDLEYKSYFIRLIYSFHMPAFFVISGFLFNVDKWRSRGFKAFLLNRANKDLIPYFFFEYLYGIVATIFFFELSWKGKIMELLYVIKRSFSVEVNYVPSWFLITLFFAGIIVYWLSSRNKKNILIEIIFLTAISITGGQILNIMDAGFIRDLLIFLLRIALSSVFMLFGLLRKSVDSPKINQSIAFLVCLAVTMVLPFFLEWESISSFSIKFIILFVLTGITGTCVVVRCSKCFDCRLLRFLGRESLIIMGTHQAIKYALLFRTPDIYYSRYVIPVYFIGVVVLSAILIPLFNKYVPFLIGKKGL